MSKKGKDYIDKDIGVKLHAIAEGNGASQTGVVNEIDKILGYDSISQPTVNRYFSGQSDPTASFLQAFCKAYGASADYILGLATNTIDSEIVTPQIALSNLLLVLNQLELKIEFNNEHTKVMLTTENEHLINFLFPIRKSQYYTMKQIDYFCKSNELAMLGNHLLTYKELYIMKEQEKFSENSEGAEQQEIEQYLRQRSEQIDKSFDEDTKGKLLDLEKIFSIEWNNFNEKEKEAQIKEIEEWKKKKNTNNKKET